VCLTILVTVTSGESNRGRRTLILNSNEFWFAKEYRSGNILWYCRQRRRRLCHASVETLEDGETIFRANNYHSHDNDVVGINVRRTVRQMQHQITQLGATPAAVIATNARQLSPTEQIGLPYEPSLRRRLQRTRSAAINQGSPIPRDRNFIIPNKFSEMVLADSGPGQDRIIMLGITELLFMHFLLP
jgi:FLYWCH zinc finger domain